MAKELKTALSVVLTDTDIQKSSRFMDSAVIHTPVSHETGQANLPGGTVDHQIAAGVNQIVLVSTSPFSVKIGDTTNPDHLNMKLFAYDGEVKDFFISNPGADPISIDFTSAKYS